MQTLPSLLLLVLLSLSTLATIFGENAEENTGEKDDGGNLPDLVIKVIKKPRNCTRRAAPGDILRVHYVGRLGDSKKGEIFDSSLERDR